MRFLFLFVVYNFVSAYNITHMINCVHFSGAAYCDNYTSLNVTELYDVSTDAKGFVGVFDDIWYVAIRGSSSITNWEDDFEIRLVPYPACDCMVHRGFYESALSLKQQLIAHLPNKQSKIIDSIDPIHASCT